MIDLDALHCIFHHWTDHDMASWPDPDSGELQCILRLLGYEAEPSEVILIMEKYDLDGSGIRRNTEMKWIFETFYF